MRRSISILVGLAACVLLSSCGGLRHETLFFPCSVGPNCPKCHGTGEYRCTRCLGRGSAICERCNQKGTTVCLICGGTGKKAFSTTGNDICTVCNGSGHATCGACNGTGMTSCPDCGGKGMVSCGTKKEQYRCKDCGETFDYKPSKCPKCKKKTE